MNLQLRCVLVMLAMATGVHPHCAVSQALDEPEILAPSVFPQPRINGKR